VPFLIDRFPGPLERLAEEQLPNASDQLHGAVLHRGKLYVTGLLAIHELDPQTGRVLRMSDVRRADCGSANLAIVGEHLFASCVPAGQKPGPHGQKPEQVHEINLATGALVRRYGPAHRVGTVLA
jgi:hypothetical protein